MKKAIICFSVICMCIVVSYVTRLLTIKEYSMETRVETIYLFANDNFPDDIDTYTLEKEKADYSISGEHYKAFFNLSDTCEACIEQLESIRKIINIFTSTEIKFYIIWNNEAPEKLLDKYGIDRDINYTLMNLKKINRTLPFMFILDKDNKVLLTTNEINILLDKVLALSENRYFENSLLRLSTPEYF